MVGWSVTACSPPNDSYAWHGVRVFGSVGDQTLTSYQPIRVEIDERRASIYQGISRVDSHMYAQGIP